MLAVVSASGIIAMLHLLASAIRNLTYMHDLKHQVYRLKVEYEARKRAMDGPAEEPGGEGEFDILPETGAREAA